MECLHRMAAGGMVVALANQPVRGLCGLSCMSENLHAHDDRQN